MLKIAIYCCDFHPTEGGYSFAFQALATGLSEADENCRIDIFTPVSLKGKAEIETERVSVHRINAQLSKAFPRTVRGIWHLMVRSWKIARTIEIAEAANNYDFILFESIDDPFVLLFLSKLIIRRKVIVRIHATSETEYALWGGGLWAKTRSRIIKRLLCTDIKYITATSPFYLEFAKKWYLGENQLLIAKKRFFVIPNGVKQLGVRRNFEFDSKRVRFLTLGRMDTLGANQKGFDDILMALMLLPDHMRPRVTFTFVGKGIEHDRIVHLSKSVSGVEFVFEEALSNAEVKKRLAVTDCVVLASRYEGMSVFAMESLIHGCPVIFSDVGGIRGFVDGNGFLFPAGDAMGLSEAIAKVATSTEAELTALSKRSLDIIKNYTPQSAALKLLQFSKLVT